MIHSERRDIKDTLPPNEGARKLLKIAASRLSCSVFFMCYKVMRIVEYQKV